MQQPYYDHVTPPCDIHATPNCTQEILSALQPRLAPDEDGSVRDNAIGALSRLVSAFGAKLPLDQILPAIVGALPLQADVGENAPAIRCLMALTRDEATRGLLGSYMSQLLIILGKLLLSALEEPLQSTGVLDEMRAFVGWLHSLAPEQLQQGVMALPESDRAPLLEALQGGQVV